MAKYNDNDELITNLSAAEATIDRLKEALGATSDRQLAGSLGISRQNISAARKRDEVPTGWIYKVAEVTGCSMDWLGFGKGPAKKRAGYDEPGPEDRLQIASPQAAYRRQGGSKPPPEDRHLQKEEAAGFGAAVEMLAEIYNSGDEALIGAASASLRALREVANRK